MIKEDSFISLLATIIPMSVLLSYYLGDKFAFNLDRIFEIIDVNLTLELNGNFINIYSGCDTIVAATFLESTHPREIFILSRKINNK